jgi:beta-phosphoglucomutase-like phosphatase (HAD superfamily)
VLGLPTKVRACLFDLEGVLTETAKFVDHPCKRLGEMAYRTPSETTRRVARWGRT